MTIDAVGRIDAPSDNFFEHAIDIESHKVVHADRRPAEAMIHLDPYDELAGGAR